MWAAQHRSDVELRFVVCVNEEWKTKKSIPDDVFKVLAL